jgi:hypothetical protein
VRKPCLRLFSPQPCCGRLAGEARLRPLKAGARLPHSKVGPRYTQPQIALEVEQRLCSSPVVNPCTLCQLSKHFPAAEIVEAGRNAAIDSEQLLRHILGAKFDYFFALVHGSAHARELIDAKNQLSSGLFTQADRRYLRFLTATIVGAAERGKLYPNRVRLEPDAVAELLVRSAAGNELYGTTPPTTTVFRRRLDALVRVFVVGLGG